MRLRSGIFWHKGAGQYASTIGYRLNAAGKRVRATQYLGEAAEGAEARHADLQKIWAHTKRTWAIPYATDMTFAAFLRHGLPDAIREIAQLSLPVEFSSEWCQRAKATLQAEGKEISEFLDRIIIEGTISHVKRIEDSRAVLIGDVNNSEMARLLATMSPELQARLFSAAQPPANIIQGFAPNAKYMTLGEAKTQYLIDLKSRIGLPGRDGLKPGSYANVDRALRLGLDIKDDHGHPVIDAITPMHEITRDDLVRFKRAWLTKAN